MSLIIKAAQLANALHRGQTRKYTNRPYIEHPIRIAGRIATFEFADKYLVATGFLHDVIEDCNITWQQLENLTGSFIVAQNVLALTNPSKGSTANRAVRKQMDRDHIASAPKKIKIIKLLDRIDNLNEIDPHDDFCRVYCEESLLLAEVLKDADEPLYVELMNRIAFLQGN